MESELKPIQIEINWKSTESKVLTSIENQVTVNWNQFKVNGKWIENQLKVNWNHMKINWP